MWDFLPTVAELTGMDTPEGLDGISILPTLLGETDKQRQHEFLYWEYKEEQAVRMSNWYGYKNKKGFLEIYNLEDNPGQDKDLSADYPDIARKIDEIMIREHSPSDVWPSPGEAEDEFKQRMVQLGITAEERPLNVADF
jgi:arylsulfatase A-like enzyme